jgi:hypothetical protein
MKNFLILAIIIGGAGFYWKRFKVDDSAPVHIVHPVYSEIRITLDIFDRSLEGVLYAKTASEQECRTFAAGIINRVLKQTGEKGAPRWKLGSTDCKEQLAPRHARLFDNEPSFVSYASLSPGNNREREMRIIYWGITRDESDQICNLLDRQRLDWKGPVRCIKAAAQ